MTSFDDDDGASLMTPHMAATDPAFAALLLSSHLSLAGEPLCPAAWETERDAARWLYEQAPFGLLAHDTSVDPRFVYANRTAQDRFGYSWDEFVGLPSRLSARPDGQEDREAFVRAVTDDHYATGYQGIRVGKGGRTFWIEDVTMWDLIDTHGRIHGQAAVFRSSSPTGR
ncbi:MEKHLA domain-containing protein [Streptomyces brasiliensis]|uniref:MEKHLA domain-containing protein n=1 Tax=Streptomyces brasiliensis TaxID=1954 RepID=A0A917P3S3_9ACTN|nr:MEKHLA domain-containing protein [Streptomyces brasiliensis]GGJ58744.1 MEKHLA domain-containing protein [Streptomyces brasiliensis]